MNRGIFCRFYVLAMAVLLACPTTASASPETVIEGQVVDEDSNQPLANVIVTVVWVAPDRNGIACLYSAAAFSDEHGRFRIPEWRHPVRIGRFGRIERVVLAYAPGYVQHRSAVPTVIRLKRDRSSNSERLIRLDRWRAEATCVGSAGGRPIVSPLHDALLAEARTLVDEQSNPQALEPFLFDVEAQRFGEQAAKQRQQERQKGWQR